MLLIWPFFGFAAPSDLCSQVSSTGLCGMQDKAKRSLQLLCSSTLAHSRFCILILVVNQKRCCPEVMTTTVNRYLVCSANTGVERCKRHDKPAMLRRLQTFDQAFGSEAESLSENTWGRFAGGLVVWS